MKIERNFYFLTPNRQYGITSAVASVGQVPSHQVISDGFIVSCWQSHEGVLFQLVLYLGCNILQESHLLFPLPFKSGASIPPHIIIVTFFAMCLTKCCSLVR